MSVDVKYAVSATASGGGRDGRTRLDDGTIDLNLVLPRELGGAGNVGANPEKLFALSYSACFLTALRVAAGQIGTTVPLGTTVNARIGIGPRPEGGFGLTVALDVLMPGMASAEAGRLVGTAHRICPYSHALSASVEITTTIRA